MGLIETVEDQGFLTTTVDSLVNWARKNAVWPMPLGISCCAIEMMAFAGPRYDVSRFGSEVFRFSPRQSDLLIVAGTVTYKMSKVVRKIYDQMPDPKYVMAMGACTSSGGIYRTYAVVQGINQFLPVDIYVAGCPPRPDSLIKALMEIQAMISGEKPFKRGTVIGSEEKMYDITIPEHGELVKA
ncbi:MAG TPA: NADH-quinone oxidoreductase subunit B family protein [Candidatus Kapabacteria bacterium]|nr:NADH-quinone oxidoreductase subunit B family protein [Candidatus Kapabacteria bacterium]